MPGGQKTEEASEKLRRLVESVATTLCSFSCEIVDYEEDSHYVKIRNCRSNTFSFSSSLFAVLRPFQGNLKASIYTYNEEELESELLTWDLDVISNVALI